MNIKIYGKKLEEPQDTGFLGNQEIERVKTFEIIGPVRGETPFSESISETDLLEFQFEDDTVWMTRTDDMSNLFGSQSRAESEGFEIPDSIEWGDPDRGDKKKVALKRLSIFSFSPRRLTEGIALSVAGKLENTLVSHGLNNLDPNFALQPFDSTHPEGQIDVFKPILLFIHGTSSNTTGSFGELKGSKAWEDLCREYGQNILSYEHRTWTLSPLQNALDLLNALPENARIHLITHSRGGIVGDLLCRCNHSGFYFSEAEMTDLARCGRREDAEVLAAINKLAAEKNVMVEKMVRVACPASGTTLLSKRLDHFLNFLLNLVGYSAGQLANPIFHAIRSLLAAILDQKNQSDVLPGLEAMIPDSPLQNLLNNQVVQVPGELRIIAGNAGPASVKKTLLYLLTRLYYRTDNDFVVDTDAMFMGISRKENAYYHFVSGKDVDHFSYFKQEGVQQNIFDALTKEIENLPDFKVVRWDKKNRAIGLPPVPVYEKPDTGLAQSVKVRIMNGHLNYARYPLIIGHFKDDGIVSAERVMDDLLKGKLAERLQFGSYPGAIGTNLIQFLNKKMEKGAIIVGLGEPENLTPFLLSQTIEQGCLDYVLARKDHSRLPEKNGYGISTLLVGNSYGNLTLSNSILAILEGVVNANKKIQQPNSDLAPITEVEFVELYEDKTINAFYAVNEIIENHQLSNIELLKPIQEVSGKRSFPQINSEKEWWKRIFATLEEEKDAQAPYLLFNASTGRAKVEVRKLFTSHRILEALLEENSKYNTWNRRLTKTIFELLIPNDFKLSFRNQQNILLILDKDTAKYPWELLHYDSKAGDPICVSAGMIRQLATSDDRRTINPVNNRHALIIGDPLLTGPAMNQLPGAEQEARVVNKQLRSSGYTATLSIQRPFKEILEKLSDEYKIIHVASHGVINFGKDKRTGILLSDDIVLSTAEINQMSTTPELVFVNSCFLGKVDPEKEAHFRNKFQLAANIGTELIEIGVKAVVVAGWAVNDNAAGLFAEVFYREMLNGEYFGEAVKRARRACYEKFGTTNTWGAYQCYGDPFYQLEKKSRRSAPDQPYMQKREILIDLEIQFNKARSAEKSNAEKIRKELEEINRKIEASGLRNGPITELEALTYAEIGDFEKAIALYEKLQSENKAIYSVRALEQWCNLKGQYLLSLKDTDRRKEAAGHMKEVIDHLTYLIAFGETTERYSLLGSAFKRKAMLLTGKKETEEAIIDMAKYYQKGYLLKNEDHRDRRFYPLANWLLGELLLADNKRKTEVEKKLGTSIPDFLKQKIKEARRSKDQKEFWDLIEIINYHQCLLFFAEGKRELEELRKKILSGYREALKIDGSEKNKNSEIVHMKFIEDTLIKFGKADLPACHAIKNLLKDFE